ncbi:MAG: Txe/YoeB family addiction module toxin [Clostridia bacterium]|jgi:Txe/YoeB family toxin of toxin-antitoxin system|nr:Txe/YoeB family addiction module toxin [Clostridia bacterium]
MVGYAIIFDERVRRHIELLKAARLEQKAKALIDILRSNPFKNPPPFEKLQGNLNGLYSRRINIRHRLVYQVFEKEKIVRILSMWSHYDF